MFMRKKTVQPEKSGGRNVQHGDIRGEASNFGQRGNHLPSHHGGHSLSTSSQGGNSYGGNPPSSTRGGNSFPSPHERNPYGGPEGGRESASNLYQGYQNVGESSKTDRGSNFNSRWDRGNSNSSTSVVDYQHHRTASVDPSRGVSASYTGPVTGSNSRFSDSDRRSTTSFGDRQSQRGNSAPYMNRERDQDRSGWRGGSDSKPSVNMEEAALGILDKVLAADPKLATQSNPPLSNEHDGDRYGGRQQVYEQDHLKMGAPTYPSNYVVPDQRYNSGQVPPSNYVVPDQRYNSGQVPPSNYGVPDQRYNSGQGPPSNYMDPDPRYHSGHMPPSNYMDQDPRYNSGQGPPSNYMVPDPRYNSGQGPPPMQMGNMNSNMYPPNYPMMGNPEYASNYDGPPPWYNNGQGPPPMEYGSMPPPGMMGFRNDMYGNNSHQQQFQDWNHGVDQFSRKRSMEYVENPDYKKARASIISRLGPKHGVSGKSKPSKGGPAGNKMQKDKSESIARYESILKLRGRISFLDVNGLTSVEMKSVALNYKDYPKQALSCTLCDKYNFSSILDFFHHGNSIRHLERFKCLESVVNSTLSYLSNDAQLAYGRSIGVWNPTSRNMCTLCNVPSVIGKKKKNHVDIRECWIVHQYDGPGCCGMEGFKDRLQYEIHRTTLWHLKGEYVHSKNIAGRDEKELERLREYKEMFKKESTTDEERNQVSLRLNNFALAQEAKVWQQFGKTEIPVKVLNLMKTFGVKEESRAARKRHNPNKFHFHHYKPSATQWVNQITFITDFECTVCRTTMGDSKQSVIDHCSSKDHYDNLVKKLGEKQSVMSKGVEDDKEKGANERNIKKKENIKEEKKEENVKEEKKEENVKEEKKEENVREEKMEEDVKEEKMEEDVKEEKMEEDREKTVTEASGKSKWARRGEDEEEEEEEDNAWGYLLGDEQVGDDAEEDNCDDDDALGKEQVGDDAEEDNCDDDDVEGEEQVGDDAEEDNCEGDVLGKEQVGDDAEEDNCDDDVEGEEQVGDDAEEDNCDDDDDVRMDNLEYELEEAVNELDDLNDKKGEADQSKDEVPVLVDLEKEDAEVVDLPKEEEADKDETQQSGENTSDKEEELATMSEGENKEGFQLSSKSTNDMEEDLATMNEGEKEKAAQLSGENTDDKEEGLATTSEGEKEKAAQLSDKNTDDKEEGLATASEGEKEKVAQLSGENKEEDLTTMIKEEKVKPEARPGQALRKKKAMFHF